MFRRPSGLSRTPTARRHVHRPRLERLEDRHLLTDSAATFTVFNTNDTGEGSLRQAISAANANQGAATIDFKIPGAGVQTIEPLSPLPAITNPVTIDGYSQPGSSPNTNAPDQGNNAVLLIELRGDQEGAGYGNQGLLISAGNSTIQGLVIDGFDQ